MSAAGHLSLVLVAQFGLPFLFTSPPVTATVIPVEVVTIDDVTRPPAPSTPLERQRLAGSVYLLMTSRFPPLFPIVFPYRLQIRSVEDGPS